MTYTFALLGDDQKTRASMWLPAFVVSLDAPAAYAHHVIPALDALVVAGFEPAEAPVTVAAGNNPPVADVRVGAGGLMLVTRAAINGGIVVDDPGQPPVAPPGWWDEVKRFGEQCAVIIGDRLDLRSGDPRAAMTQAANRRRLISARATVTHAYP